MPYVASPSYSENSQARAANLIQCMSPARRHLEEVSHASDAEKFELLVAAATEAGWEEDEVREALHNESGHSTLMGNNPQGVSIGLVPTSPAS